MKKIKILLLITMGPFIAFAQGQGGSYSISGRVNLIIGLDMVPAQEALVTVKNSGQVATTDSLGIFMLENLQLGKHQLQVLGASFPAIDTSLTITEASITGLSLLAVADCSINKNIAQRDIKKKEPRLLIMGGIAPVVYVHQEKFEKKYDVKYYDFGCVAPNEKCIEQYNQVVFKYLDSKYGKKWRKEVRKDVVGM
ncbi:carboxypeptidase-like regulatory domain-containing protein [Pontibacter sp. 13R65]|uniref:carboxypeptidase-like regulatory domain-containing protein n=1 Tax=Pontibacter sp. 13R65 TaxID=3127458 RepID=UPI00301E41B5